MHGISVFKERAKAFCSSTLWGHHEQSETKKRVLSWLFEPSHLRFPVSRNCLTSQFGIWLSLLKQTEVCRLIFFIKPGNIKLLFLKHVYFKLFPPTLLLSLGIPILHMQDCYCSLDYPASVQLGSIYFSLCFYFKVYFSLIGIGSTLFEYSFKRKSRLMDINSNIHFKHENFNID